MNQLIVYRDRSFRFGWLALFGLLLLLMPGCEGCRSRDPKTSEPKQDKEEDVRKKEEDEKKPAFETRAPVPLPGRYEKNARGNQAKKGHWVTFDVRMIANKFDSRGELNAVAINQLARRPSQIPRTNRYVRSIRPVSLPKREWRDLEISVFVPKNKKLKNTSIEFNYGSEGGSIPLASTFFSSTAMMPHQHHLVVLTRRPDRYAFVPLTDSVLIPDVTFMGERFPVFYRVIRTRPDKDPIPLPRNALNWTTTAYLIWDDLDPDELDEDQQQALVDWLHFGGQLIVSAPDCLNKLQNSFLADYLPARFIGSRNLTPNDFKEFNQYWTIANEAGIKQPLKVSELEPMLGMQFEPHPDAAWVPSSGDLVVERPVGRGRVVATAFSLEAAPLRAWPSFGSFFNACLLRRPARRFGLTSNETLSFVWTDDATSIWDPLIASTLRFTSRDLSNTGMGTIDAPGIEPMPDNTDDFIATGNVYFYNDQSMIGSGLRLQSDDRSEERKLSDRWHYGGYQHDPESGVAGWSDTSGIAVAARGTLRDAAGITPPSSQFVLKMLAVYLLVLVPVNWGVFRMMGHVEWAWIAAPFIAIAGALAVAKMASLDIGFVRSQVQVNLLEVHAGYPRAHLAQYNALYTSLSTAYDLQLDNPTGQVLPFGRDARRFQKAERLSPVAFRRTLTSRLEDLQIQSNTTEMVHAEMMLDLQGDFRLITDDSQQVRVRNTTVVQLHEAGVLARLENGQYRVAWIGALAAGDTSGPLVWKRIDPAAPADAFRDFWIQRAPGLISTRYRAQQIWDSFDGVVNDRLEISRLRERAEFADNWSTLIQLILRRVPGTRTETIESSQISHDQFLNVYDDYYAEPQINVSRLLDAVLDNLELAPGERRLLGTTRQELGDNRFEPGSTQMDRQTLVLVHLQRPPFDIARPDKNLMVDFLDPTTSLDWEDLQKETESTSEDEQDEAIDD